MGKFTDTPREKEVLNNYIDNWVTGIADYSKYFEAAPNFVTYYSIDLQNSTENGGLGNVLEIVGNESPIKFNKVNNLPIFSADEVTPHENNDRIEGTSIDYVSSTAVILPGTISPQPGDLLVFSYHEHADGLNYCFRVSDANQNIIASNVYYEIVYDIEPFDIDILNSRQVSNEYYVVYENIGTDHQAVIIEKDFRNLQKLEGLKDDIEEYYIEDYYNKKLNSLVCEEDSVFYYDPYLHEFSKNNSVFIQPRRTMKNIFLDSTLPIKRTDYKRSLYSNIEDSSDNLSFMVTTTDVSTKAIFASFPYKVLSLAYATLPGNRNIDSLSPLFQPLFSTNLNGILDSYENINSIGDNLDPYERIILFYLKDPSKIDSVLISELKDFYLSNNNGNNLQDYTLMPIVLYIISKTMDYIVDNS